MPVGAIVGGVAGAGIAANASKKAASLQANAANKSTNLQKKMFETTQANLQPFMQTGAGAMKTLASLYGIATPDNPNPQAFNADAIAAFERSPDYGFAFDQGQKALQYSLGAKGLLRSGAALQELTKFGQGLATQNFGNYAGRLFQLSSLGASAAGTGASAATAAGTGMAATTMAGGNALASGQIGQANAINAGISGVVNNLSLYNAMNNRSAYQNFFPNNQPMLSHYGPGAFGPMAYQPAPFYGVGSAPY